MFDLPVIYGRVRRIYRRTLGILSARRATRVVTVSHDMARFLQRRLGLTPERLSVVGEGVDLARFRPGADGGRAYTSRYGRYFLSVGTLWPYKNHELSVRALAHWRRVWGADARLLIVGRDWNGQQAALQHLSHDLGVREAVSFLGFVPWEEMPGLYAGATALLCPSRVESFGLPVLEAMASGTPVIASNCCALPETVGGAGICLDPDDPTAWAEAMHAVATDPSLRADLIARGLARASLRSWTATAADLLRVLREVAA
jgi:glycosyltransferase involved in cell wall biosynthesis